MKLSLLHLIGAGVSLLLLVAVVSGPGPNQNRGPETGHSNNAAANERAEVKPPPVIGITPPETRPQTNDEDDYAEQADLIAQRWMAWSAAWLLLVTSLGVGLVGITVWQTRGVLKEAKETTKAANRTVDETRRIGEAQVRAYLTFEDGAFQLGNNIRLTFKIVNAGQSPAQFILANKVSITVSILDKQTTFSRAIDPSLNTYLGTLRSGADSEKSIATGLTERQAAQIVAARLESDILFAMAGVFKWTNVFDKDEELPFAANLLLKRGKREYKTQIQCDGVSMQYVDALWTTANNNSEAQNQ